jgi:hypothetical protein
VIIIKLGRTPLNSSDQEQEKQFFVKDGDRFVASMKTQKFSSKSEA